MLVLLKRLFLCLKEQHAKKATSFIICLSEVGIIVINNSVKINFLLIIFVVVISDGCVYALKRSLKPVAGSVDE